MNAIYEHQVTAKCLFPFILYTKYHCSLYVPDLISLLNPTKETVYSHIHIEWLSRADIWWISMLKSEALECT